ncbi:unnamed protein product [Diatraea saccharalis]|uniref:Uncharacterized protein n=1 Tax=Diatraea saccharalis TaxID=40085 RepID=A0A9N9R8W6_9NEOP|nr:unnamed protein product [Diatraea saccharalis]
MDTEFKDLKHSDFVALMARSDREEIIVEEHQQILNKEVVGSFEANNSNPGLNQFIHKRPLLSGRATTSIECCGWSTSRLSSCSARRKKTEKKNAILTGMRSSSNHSSSKSSK